MPERIHSPEIHVVPYSDTYQDKVIDLFEQIFTVTNGLYPPREAFRSREDLAAKLFKSAEAEHWIALRNENVLGHISVEPLSPSRKSLYWERALPQVPEQDYPTYLQLTKLAVCPCHTREGIGTLLFKTAIHQIEQAGKIPILLVLEELSAARSFYRRMGGCETARFPGTYGKPLLSVVFPETLSQGDTDE